MMGVDAISLDELAKWQAGFDGLLPLQQSAAYGAALSMLGSYVRAVKADGMVGLMLERRFVLGLVLRSLMRGPVGAVDVEAQQAFARACAPSWPSAMLWSDADAPLSAERVATKPLMSAYHTVWCDVVQGLQPHAKWQRNLERVPQGLVFRVQPWNSAAGVWLRGHENEQQQQRGYKALPAAFVDAFVLAKGKVNLMAVYEKKEIVAAQLYLRHGKSATYWMGATSERGRELFAHYALLTQMMDYLRGRGTKWLDLGGVDTVHNAGLARFKLGTGGVVTGTGGTWLV